METYLTVEETAETLKVSVDSVRRWLRSGKLRGNRYGRVWRVPLSELRCTGRASRHEEERVAPGSARDGHDHNGSEAKQRANERSSNEVSASEPRQRLTEFLRLAAELAPLIEMGKANTLTNVHISDAVAGARGERHKEICGQ